MTSTMNALTISDELQLIVESTLQDLRLWEVKIDLNYLGSDLEKLFKDEPLLPGIIITHHQHYVGMVSRRRFFEHMSRPFSLELFLNHPIERFLNIFKIEKESVLYNTTSVIEATQIALQRSPEQLYEPIIVQSSFGRHQLLDFHQLLLSYSQIQVLTLTHLQQARQQTKISEPDFYQLQEHQIRLLHNEKIATLKQVICGIANEINHPTNVLAGNLLRASRYIQNLLELISLYQQHYPEPAVEIKTAIDKVEIDNLTINLSKLLDSMKAGTNRIKQFVYSLQNFYTNESEKKAIDIHESLESALLILQNRLKFNSHCKNITIIKEYSNLPLVECYPGELNLVFINILSNAIDALEEGLEIGDWELGKDSSQYPVPTIRIRTKLANSHRVVIHIANNGIGMTEAVKQRIFDPFFTTKPVGKGTGLGLSISYQIIVEKHGGTLEVNSAIRQGSEFAIAIPIKQDY
ncbi:sensor histidine kinase [Fischerella sp. PCC 9605]|uniref:sensor histidine kinase n=1 Tax=Fischerella sp. PCC 9605 TaxID=1173024 RepID=UPI0004B783DA|nr:ATP-binding protein [Fischerella sp. PCC 9605]